MTRFEPRISGVRSNCSTNWATPTGLIAIINKKVDPRKQSKKRHNALNVL